MKRKDLIAEPSTEYELLDIGDGRKLERYGDIVLERPDPQAVCPKSTPAWKPDAVFYGGEQGGWKILTDKDVKQGWKISVEQLSFNIRPYSFKHTGLFPEHAPHWKWIQSHVDKNDSVINFFGYTGGSTVAAAKTGAQVCHVDASKVAVQAASENALLNELDKAPIRWIVDDALAFAKREARREAKYTGIIMDPPAFGRGPKGQVWKIEDNLIDFVRTACDLLAEKPSFMILNGYAAGYGADAYGVLLKRVISEKRPDLAKSVNIEYGDMSIKVSGGVDNESLPAGIYAKAFWQ